MTGRVGFEVLVATGPRAGSARNGLDRTDACGNDGLRICGSHDDQNETPHVCVLRYIKIYPNIGRSHYSKY